MRINFFSFLFAVYVNFQLTVANFTVGAILATTAGLNLTEVLKIGRILADVALPERWRRAPYDFIFDPVPLGIGLVSYKKLESSGYILEGRVPVRNYLFSCSLSDFVEDDMDYRTEVAIGRGFIRKSEKEAYTEVGECKMSKFDSGFNIITKWRARINVSQHEIAGGDAQHITMFFETMEEPYQVRFTQYNSDSFPSKYSREQGDAIAERKITSNDIAELENFKENLGTSEYTVFDDEDGKRIEFDIKKLGLHITCYSKQQDKSFVGVFTVDDNFEGLGGSCTYFEQDKQGKLGTLFFGKSDHGYRFMLYKIDGDETCVFGSKAEKLFNKSFDPVTFNSGTTARQIETGSAMGGNDETTRSSARLSIVTYPSLLFLMLAVSLS